jgi:hypothetical protein
MPKISLKSIFKILIALLIFFYIKSLINSNKVFKEHSNRARNEDLANDNFLNKSIMNENIDNSFPVIHLPKLNKRRELGNLLESMKGKKMIEVNNNTYL